MQIWQACLFCLSLMPLLGGGTLLMDEPVLDKLLPLCTPAHPASTTELALQVRPPLTLSQSGPAVAFAEPQVQHVERPPVPKRHVGVAQNVPTASP